MKNYPTLIFIVMIFFYSCDRPSCINKNPVFDQCSPYDEEYKAELARQIHNIKMDKLNFWHEQYIKVNNKEFLMVHIQYADLCAIMQLEVNDWRKLSGLRRKVSGYRGAGLLGLQFEIKQDSLSTRFIYKDIDYILD